MSTSSVRSATLPFGEWLHAPAHALNVVRLAVKWSESTGWSQPANWIAAGMGASALLTFAYLWATPAASDKSSSSKTKRSSAISSASSSKATRRWRSSVKPATGPRAITSASI